MLHMVWKGAVNSNIAWEHYKLWTITQSGFVVDMRKRLRSIWCQANQLGNEDQTDKAAKHHNWVALPLRWLLMDRLFLYLGICIWIWACKHSATGRVSGYIPICCVSRQEAGNIMMVPVISVACRQFKTKSMLFSYVLACKCVLWSFNLQTCFTIYHWHTKLLSIRLELFISPKLVLRMPSIFSRDKVMISIVLSPSLSAPFKLRICAFSKVCLV